MLCIRCDERTLGTKFLVLRVYFGARKEHQIRNLLETCSDGTAKVWV